MSPFACMRSQIATEERWWRGSVVRMKSSFEQLSRFTMAWKRGTLRSASSRGVRFSLAAVCTILMPCSSVPVRKNTSWPSSRMKRAMASVAIAS